MFNRYVNRNRERILFFDLLRIIAILLIVSAHLPGLPIDFLHGFIYDTGKTSLTYYVTSGPIGVYILVFVSGAVLYQSYSNKIINYWNFIIKRLKRIYPSYWLALISCMILAPSFLIKGKYIIPQFLGFMPSPMYYAWWIGLFISLYSIFPILIKLIKKYPLTTLGLSLLITVISRILISGVEMPVFGFPMPLVDADRVFFLCFLFEFTLGMFIVQKKLYPKGVNNNKYLLLFSDLSYYIFLTHTIVRQFLFNQNTNLIWQPNFFVYYLLVVLLASSALMSFDTKMQQYLARIKKSKNAGS